MTSSMTVKYNDLSIFIDPDSDDIESKTITFHNLSNAFIQGFQLAQLILEDGETFVAEVVNTDVIPDPSCVLIRTTSCAFDNLDWYSDKGTNQWSHFEDVIDGHGFILDKNFIALIDQM